MRSLTTTAKYESKPFFATVQMRLFLILGIMVLGLFIVQFFILSSVGTVGPKISQVRREREELQLDNELKLALIREYQTNQQVVDTVSADMQMQQVEVNYLRLNNADTTTAAIVK